MAPLRTNFFVLYSANYQHIICVADFKLIYDSLYTVSRYQLDTRTLKRPVIVSKLDNIAWVYVRMECNKYLMFIKSKCINYHCYIYFSLFTTNICRFVFHCLIPYHSFPIEHVVVCMPHFKIKATNFKNVSHPQWTGRQLHTNVGIICKILPIIQWICKFRGENTLPIFIWYKLNTISFDKCEWTLIEVQSQPESY